jgi:FkbM family methyltransferase
MTRTLRHTARRLRQTVQYFDNGPALLGSMLRPAGADLEFRLPGGGTVVCPNLPGARVPVYEVFVEDTYRLGWLTADLPPSPAALDIGGHIGCFSIAFARLHPQGRVTTYEASPTTAAYLRRNVEANGLTDRVRTRNAAVAATGGTLELADNAGGSALNGLTTPHAGSGVVQVPAVDLAAALADAGGADLVKIDTEGAEYDIVLASDPGDWAGVRRVVLEYHPVPGHDWAELEAFFGTAGLTVVAREDVPDVAQGTVWLSRGPLA